MADRLKELKKKVFDANMKLSGSGLVIATFGNVSGIDRTAQVIAIKPSGIEYSQMKEDDMVLVALSGEKIEEGSPNPSSDTDTHLELYRSFAGIGGVTHSHSNYATAFAQAKMAIEAHLSQFLDSPEVSVDVFAYNSKVYYVVTQGAGMGDGVYRFSITGNETVLDAISQINGLEQVSSKRIWIARPTCGSGNVQVLPVSWEAITAQASTNTNYQVMPGDRVFIAEDKLIALDTSLAKIIAPMERIMGFSLLGAGVATRFSGPVLQGGGNRRGSF